MTQNHKFLADGVITLRALEPSDVDMVYRWENDTSLWPVGCATAPMSRHMLWEYAQNYTADIFTAGQLRMVVEETATGAPIGLVDLFDLDHHSRRAGVGVLIDAPYRGRGFGGRALEAACGYALGFVGLHQVWAHVPIDNATSLSLFRSHGFEICGRFRSWLRRGHSYADVYMLQRLGKN